MSLYGFPEGQIIAFALVFLRIAAFVVAWPIFGNNLVPPQVKVLLALTMTLAMFPSLHFSNAAMLTINDQIPFMAFREICIGLVLGFLMRAFFFAVTMAGDIISVSVGLGSAQLYNPAMGAHGNVLEQFQLGLASLLFLALNGHHIFLGGLASSFDLVPVSEIALKYKSFAGLTTVGQQILEIGLKLSAPVLVAILITNIALGVLGRAVPQINILITSLPVTIMVGFAVLFLTTPLYVEEMGGLTRVMADEFFKIMRVL